MLLAEHVIDNAIKLALAEDLGERGDITSRLTINPSSTSTAILKARQDGVLSGVHVAARVFKMMNADLEIICHKEDGDVFKKGDRILTVTGNAIAILEAERVALNFMGRMSGIASITGKMQSMINHTKAKLCCTRKTTPGLRAFEKYAVRCGGGQNHRYGLYDAILIKDNHIAANDGDIRRTVDRALSQKDHLTKIEVEVDTFEQLEKIVDLPIDAVLLDNMSPETLKRCVALVKGRFLCEASGGVREETIVPIAETGVDLVSSGWITQSAPALDFGLDF